MTYIRYIVYRPDNYLSKQTATNIKPYVVLKNNSFAEESRKLTGGFVVKVTVNARSRDESVD